MLSGINSVIFFNNLENKKDLLKSVYSYFQTSEYKDLFEIPLTINGEENTWSITKETIEVLPISSYEEADTRSIFLAAIHNKATVIVAEDTEVFLLLNYTSGQIEFFLPTWHKMTDSNQFINIKLFYCSLGCEGSDTVPGLHAITGCDIKLYKFLIETIHVFKNVCEGPYRLTLIKMLRLSFTLS